MTDNEEIHNQCLSDDPKENIKALNQLKDNFSLLPDKQQAWNDLIKLTSNKDSDVKLAAISTLVRIFSKVPDQQQAWNDLIKLTNDKDSDVKFVVVSTLVPLFSKVPNKQKAWNDLIRFVADEDRRVRRMVTLLLEYGFFKVPYKQQAWNNLIKLTSNKDSDVKLVAISVLVRIFSKMPNKQKAWDDLCKLANDVEAKQEVDKYLAGIKPTIEGLEMKKQLFEAVGNPANIVNADVNENLKSEIIREELPILDRSLKEILKRDQKIIVIDGQSSLNSDVACEQSNSKPKEIAFIALRYYIIRSEQRTLTESKYLDTPECKVRLFLDRFLQNEATYITQYDSEYVLLDIESRDNIYCGIFAKKGIRNIPEKEGPHINEKLTIEYPYVHFVCDIHKNIFCIQKKSTVYDDPLKILNILSDMVTEKIKSEGYICKFETIDQKRAFWNTLKEAKKIYYLQLTLNSPNFLNANKVARETLKELHEEYNTTTTDVTMENEEGELKVVENNKNKSYIEYAEEGGGSWTIKTDRGITKSSDKVFTLQKRFKNIFEVAEDIIHDVNGVLKYK